MSKTIGLDFGTSSLKYCYEDENEIKTLSSAVAIAKKTQQLIAIGTDAMKMLGRNHSAISLIRPIREGKVADIGGTATLINEIVEKSGATSMFRKASVIAAVPFGATKNEEHTLESAILDAGINTIDYVDAPIAIALGAGMPLDISTGRLVVDIGAGHTNAAIISHGGVVISSTAKTAGDYITASIADYMAEAHGIEVGELTAEFIKIKLGTLNEKAPKKSLKISGKVRADKNSMHGAKITATEVITSEELIPVLKPHADKIIETITGALSHTPPEISSDISDFGILLSGGGAALDGLPAYIQNALGIKVTTTKMPSQDAVRGILRIMKGGKAYSRFTR
jgi:rod shape-determining protein MreB